MTDYERTQAYIATNLLLEACLSTKLFGHLRDKNLRYSKMRATLATSMLLASFTSQMYIPWACWKVI